LSHARRRKEKDCLNCGHIVQGPFCQNCGQENIEPGMTTWGIVTHFFSDFIHFDGKYFDTVRTLFRKPGHLSLAFLQGRRASYVDPARFYLFTSAVFFLVLYTFFLDVDQMTLRKGLDLNIVTPASVVRSLNQHAAQAQAFQLRNRHIIRNGTDTLLDVDDREASNRFIDSLQKAGILDSTAVRSSGGEGMRLNILNIEGVTDIADRAEYDSIQLSLPAAKRDNWIRRFLVQRQFAIQEDFKGDPGGYLALAIDRFLHSFPTVMFLSLPFLALVLKLLYVRRRDYHYVNHAIFMVHTYIFGYLLLLFSFLSVELEKATGWSVWSWAGLGLLLWGIFYLYLSMRRFYGQSRGKTLFKMSVFLLLCFFVYLLVFSSYFVYTVLKA
jgi:hypothetical protein